MNLEWVSGNFGIKDNSYRSKSTPASERKPASVKKVPEGLGSEAKYATLGVGPVKGDKTVVVLIDDTGPEKSRLWMDANGNGDLTDDPIPTWTRRIAQPSSTNNTNTTNSTPYVYWFGGGPVTVDFGDQKRELTIKFFWYPDRDKTNPHLSYYRDFGLAGKATIAGKTYEMLVSDNTSRGDFMDGGDAWIKVDVDGNGMFDFKTENFEMKEGFELEGETYEIVGLKPGGTSFQVRESKGRRR